MAGLPKAIRDAYYEGKRLSPREKEILRLCAEGMTGREIGAQLYIAEQTVKFHLGKAMSKLGARNTTHAVAKAISYGDI